MKRTTTVLLAILVAVGMLASFAGPVAAQDDEADTSVCTIEAPDRATDSAETSLCQPGGSDDGATILAVAADEIVLFDTDDKDPFFRGF